MKKYDWVDVNSSNINKIAYDESNTELLIEFTGGNQYYYTLVPKHLFEEFLNAPSKGEFFHRIIKKDYSYGRER